MPPSIPIALALIAACATNAQDIRETGVRSVHQLKHGHLEAAAACLARNIETARGYATTIHPLTATTTEVAGYIHYERTVVVVDVSAGNAGPLATIWTRHYGFPDRAQFVRAVVKGC